MKIRCKFRNPMTFRRFRMMGGLLRASKSLSKMVYKMWRQEFSIARFKLDHHPPEDFTTCIFQKTERVLLKWIAYRGFVFFFFLITLIFSAVPYGKDIADEDIYKYIIFLTNWTYIVETIQFGIAFFNAIFRYNRDTKSSLPMPMEKTPWNYKVYWVLFTISLPISIVVTVIFWVSVYDPVKFPANSTNVIQHCLNSFFMILDFILVRHPVRFMHFYWPALYGVVYIIFSVIYQSCGGTGVKGLVPIYKILDWRHPGKAALTCIFCSIFVFVLHFFFSLLSICKTYAKKPVGNE